MWARGGSISPSPPSHVFDLELSHRTDVRKAFTLRGPVSLGWAVRDEDTKLLDALNEFLDQGVSRPLLQCRLPEVLRESGSHAPPPARTGVDHEQADGLSPYDEIVKREAAKHGFDWPLIVAQMYQESRFQSEGALASRRNRTDAAHPAQPPASSGSGTRAMRSSRFGAVPRIWPGFTPGSSPELTGRGSDLVRARRVQRRVRSCTRCASAGGPARPRSQSLVRQRRGGDASALQAALSPQVGLPVTCAASKSSSTCARSANDIDRISRPPRFAEPRVYVPFMRSLVFGPGRSWDRGHLALVDEGVTPSIPGPPQMGRTPLSRRDAHPARLLWRRASLSAQYERGSPSTCSAI